MNKKIIIKLTLFVSGAVIMILELVGSRMIAPYYGTSIYVWTSLIGVVLASLSFGYWFGGKMADRKPEITPYILIIIFCSYWLIFLVVFHNVIFNIIPNHLNVLFKSFFASMLLFTIPSFLLAVISPYSVKLMMHNLKNSGVTAGSLSSLATIGSILGTFLVGFVLIPFLRISNILIFLCFLLLVTSIFICISYKIINRKIYFLLILQLIVLISVFVITNR